MIPKHLKEKSALQICAKMKEKYHLSHNATPRDYIVYIEGLLLLAVKDALCDADGVKMCDGDYGLMGSEAEVRAIAFLNTVLPKE
jgi:hypothetical protein